MTLLLQGLVDVDNHQVDDEEGNDNTRAAILSNMKYHLLCKASNECRATVSQVITVITGISVNHERDALRGLCYSSLRASRGL